MDWKEINEAIRNLVATATEGKTGEAADAARIEALKSLDKSFTQPFFDDGFKSADGKRKGEIEAAESARKKAETELETAQSRLQELEKKNPDVQAIKQQYEQEIVGLKSTHKEELDKIRSQASQTKVDAFLTRVETAMSKRLKNDRAELAVYRLRERVKPVDGGGIEVLQPGKDIPFHAASESELIDTIVSAEYEAAPKESRLSTVDSGGGAQNGGTGGSGGNWDKIRERGKKVAAAGTTGISEESKSKRLSGL